MSIILEFADINNNPLPKFFNGARILAYLKGYFEENDAPVLLEFDERRKKWIEVSGEKRVIPVSSIREWTLPSVQWKKYIKPKIIKALTEEQKDGFLAALSDVKGFIESFNSEWVDWNRTKIKEENSITKSLIKHATNIKNARKNKIGNLLYQFIHDSESENIFEDYTISKLEINYFINYLEYHLNNEELSFIKENLKGK